MKKILSALFVALAMFGVLTMPACTTTPGSATSGTSFNDIAYKAELGVQSVQTAATSLLRAGTITLAQDQLVQKQVTLVHEGIVLAKQLQVGTTTTAADPVKAAAQLTAAIASLDALKKQTGVTP